MIVQASMEDKQLPPKENGWKLMYAENPEIGNISHDCEGT